MQPSSAPAAVGAPIIAAAPGTASGGGGPALGGLVYVASSASFGGLQSLPSTVAGSTPPMFGAGGEIIIIIGQNNFLYHSSLQVAKASTRHTVRHRLRSIPRASMLRPPQSQCSRRPTERRPHRQLPTAFRLSSLVRPSTSRPSSSSNLFCFRQLELHQHMPLRHIHIRACFPRLQPCNQQMQEALQTMLRKRPQPFVLSTPWWGNTTIIFFINIFQYN